MGATKFSTVTIDPSGKSTWGHSLYVVWFLRSSELTLGQMQMVLWCQSWQSCGGVCVCCGVSSYWKSASDLPVFLEPNVDTFFLITYPVSISEVKLGISRMWVLWIIMLFFCISDGLRENQIHGPTKLLPAVRPKKTQDSPMRAPPAEIPFLTNALLSPQGWGTWLCPIPLGATCLTSWLGLAFPGLCRLWLWIMDPMWVFSSIMSL